ncbi:MAG: T9SS type A sorting domain-containing protein [Bacteroidetes bacterium]|nr:T9SS type A sorting domain-containing protein [Bacteroidota bacterium]
MKKFNFSFLLLAAGLFFGTSQDLNAQCEDWLNPSPETGWTDFDGMFGGAPCDDGSGCAFNEITGFEVFAAEAYSVSNFIAGGSYTFSMCNGTGGTAWVAEFTIIAPSGAVDAFGAGDGDGCSITWTATEDGTYLIVINEAGACGGGDNTATSNGFPALTCNSGAPCEPLVCDSGVMTTTGAETLCGTDATVVLSTDGTEEIPGTGGFGWLFNPGADGTGALEGQFILSGTTAMEEYNSDLNGVLSTNSFPLLSGTWSIRAATYENSADAFNTICSISEDSINVVFANDVPAVDDVVDNGDGSATVTASGGTAPLTYEWSDGQTTETATDLTTGTYTVIVTDANGCTAEGSVDIVFSSVEKVDGLEFFQFGPNPTAGDLSLQLQFSETTDLQVQVLDLTGKVVYNNAAKSVQSANYEIDLTEKAGGVYFLQIIMDDQQLTERILLVK